jgi:hypothetical protein
MSEAFTDIAALRGGWFFACAAGGNADTNELE